MFTTQSSASASAGSDPVLVAIYSRASTTNPAGGRFGSVATQTAICREHIAQHASDGWFEAACFSEPASPGA
ncbi:MAG: hypothetical protein Q8N18_20925 [Opitutaceae bacterium]|nr:hypothetical protein [Opitutaceae bacterium]